MSLSTAFILGAGLGTRMGPVGEKLPKLLWPVFEKSLLELQVDYAIECGAKRVFLNTHFQAQKIHDYVSERGLEIEVLYEESLLDIGGAVHNLAGTLNYEGKILILNGDQFLFLSNSEFKEINSISTNYVVTLLGLPVPANSDYNELVLENNILKSISSPSAKDYYTYSGVSVVNLEKLRPVNGKTKFFDSVANFKEQEVYVVKPSSFEYWDFGTTTRYIDSMRKVLTSDNSLFKNFLIRNKSFIEKKVIENDCYNATGTKYSISLDSKTTSRGFGNIVIKGVDIDNGSDSVVIYDEEISKP